MSLGGGSEEGIDLQTIRDRDFPSIRQFSVFAPNKIGQLLNVMRLIESSKLRVCALSIVDSSECAIIRLVVSQPDIAMDLLDRHNYKYTEVDLLVVEMPDIPQPMLAICSSLLQAEVNIHYCFPLLVRPNERPAVGFCVDDHEMGSMVMQRAGFTVLTEHDLSV